MKREIKFRAFNYGSMGAPFNPFDSQFLSGGGTFPDETIFMQFTGLHDKNGKGIYEGDIIKHEGGHVCEVTFEHGGFQQKYIKGTETGITRRLSHSANYCEVIGNIYENPELI